MAIENSARSESEDAAQASRNWALSRLGLGTAAIYVAPAVLSLSEARESSAGASWASGADTSAEV
jgi:hypothetical protein